MQSSDESELDNDNGKGPNEIGEELDYPNTGRFIRRCVHPFVSVTNILAVAREYVRPGIGPKVRMTREEARRYSRNCAMIMQVCPQLEELLMKGGIVPHSISNEIKTGMRAARGSDAGILKNNVLRFAPPNGVIFPQSLDVKTSRGFNSDETGRMLVPVEFLEDYDKNPAEIRAKINAGHVNYRVTGGQSPAFLYEDPTEYRPFHIMDGFMRGYYLVRCFRAVYLGRRNAMNHPSTSSSTPQTGVTKKYALTTVTVPMIVYIAVLARFSLSSQEKWSSRDGLFDYDKFADTLLGMFELDEEWTADTLSWWNEQVFGDKDGVVSIVSASDPASGMLADARAQIAQRRADQEADQGECAGLSDSQYSHLTSISHG